MAGSAVIVCDVDGSFGLIEFPADDPDRALRFWSGLIGVELAERRTPAVGLPAATFGLAAFGEIDAE